MRRWAWNGVRGAMVGAMLVCALLPATAAAKVLRAESVLPPGQSGYVSATGLLEGTGSPHLLDQTELYENFEYKSSCSGSRAPARARARA